MNAIEHFFPHLDGVVSGLTPAYRTEIPFKCKSSKDMGFRDALTVDRDAEWVILGGPTLDSTPWVPRFRSSIGLRLRVDVKTGRVEDAVVEGHVLAAGLMRDFMTADRRGVVSTTGILSLAVDADQPVAYSEIEAPEGPAEAVLVTIAFIMTHGDC